MSEAETMRVSLIHPDMFNRVLRKHGIAVEVKERENGTLSASYSTETEDLSEIISGFVNQLLMYDLLVGMVLDTNVSRLKDVVADLNNLDDLDGIYDREEIEEIREDCLDTLEGIVTNLDGVIKDYREETRR